MDSSIFPDENEDPLAVSTPKRARTRTEYSCDVCGKKYQLKHYFDNHVNSHSKPSTSNHNGTIGNLSGISEALHASDVNLSALQASNASTAASVFKVPEAKKRKVKPKFTCTYCLKGYLCERSYKTHLMNHTVQAAASRYPDKTLLIRDAEKICSDALEEVRKSPSSIESGNAYRELIQYLFDCIGSVQWQKFSQAVCSELLDCVVGTKFLLPSALLEKLVDQVECVLNYTEKRLQILELLQLPNTFTCDLVNPFYVEYILCVAKVIIFYISKTVRGQDTPRKKGIPEPDEEDREVIYYIGGSIIRGYLRLAFRYKNNQKWTKIADILQSNVISDNPSKQLDAKWTVAINRGGLIFISELFQKFLVALTKVVYENEKPDCSIDYGQVIKCVSNSAISMTWDDMIGDTLGEASSINLMNDVIEYFCKTCGRGFAKQRLNMLRDRPLVSMNTRHLAASRKRKG